MSTVQISNHKSLSSVRQKSPDGENKVTKIRFEKKIFKIKITEYTQCTQKYNQLLQHQIIYVKTKFPQNHTT